MKKIDAKKLLSVFRILFAVTAIGFLVWYFVKNKEDFASIRGIDLGAFLLAMGFYFVYKITLAFLWHFITKENDCAIPPAKAVTAYLCSILGKFIPGKVFMLAARLDRYKEEGASLSRVSICFLIENVCTIIGAAVIFLSSLVFFPNDLTGGYGWAAVLLIAFFLLVIHPRVINFVLRVIGKLMKRTLYIPMTYPQLLKTAALFTANWLIVGAGFVALSRSIYPELAAGEMLYCAGVWGISAVIGILALFAPSGIGVREGIIIAALSVIMPTEYAAVIAVASRLWQTVPELVLSFGAMICSGISERKRTRK